MFGNDDLKKKVENQQESIFSIRDALTQIEKNLEGKIKSLGSKLEDEIKRHQKYIANLEEDDHEHWKFYQEKKSQFEIDKHVQNIRMQCLTIASELAKSGVLKGSIDITFFTDQIVDYVMFGSEEKKDSDAE